MRIPHLAIFAAFLGVSPVVLARPSEYRTNMREACRQAVAGGYLKQYDEREKLRTYVKSLKEQVEATATAAKKAKKAFEAAKAAAEKQTFELALAQKRDETAMTLQTLETQRKDYEDLQAEAEKTLAKATENEEALKKLIVKVFVFERLEDRPDGGYPIHLAYKSACPKFRHLCPLPREDAEKLTQIEVDGEAPDACVHYASLSKIR